MMHQSKNLRDAARSLCAAAVILLISAATFAAVPSFVNFQGYLTSPSGTPLDTTVNITFRLYPESSSSTPIWDEILSVTVVNGYYDVQLGVTDALPQSFFDDASVWLGVQIGTNAEMSPRVQYSAVPYAYRIGTIDESVGGSITGDVSISGKLNAGPYNSNEGANAFVFGANNIAAGNYSTVGGGHYNRALGAFSVVAGGGGETAADSNAATGTLSTVSGGYRNLATGDAATIAGGYEQIASGGSAVIGGGNYNQATGDGATVAGGTFHQASGMWSTISGGQNNRARGMRSFVGGGGGATADSNSALGDNSAIGGGKANSASGECATVAGGASNIASGSYSYVGGGKSNRARGLYAAVSGGGGANAADSNSARGDYSFIGGGRKNRTLLEYTSIGGGADNRADSAYAGVGGGSHNSANGQFSTIGGGKDNNAAMCGAVAGGDSNTASVFAAVVGGYYNRASARYAIIGGGYGNYTGQNYAAVCGGHDNWVSGYGSFVGGGGHHNASGHYAMIPGGMYNSAAGFGSFAAGYSAHALHDGCFVWADSSNDSLSSTGANQIIMRASGGTWVFSNRTETAGVRLPAGSSAWIAACDSTLKRRYGRVNTKDMLEKVAALPIERWSYKSQDPSIEHIGPMAQDFWNSFHLGEDSLGISTIDPDGVALAAIQELAKRNEKLEMRNQKLEEDLALLRAQVQTLMASQQESAILGGDK